MAEEIIETEVLFEYRMVDSTFRLEKNEYGFAVSEKTHDGTQIMEERISSRNAIRLNTILNRIASQSIS